MSFTLKGKIKSICHTELVEVIPNLCFQKSSTGPLSLSKGSDRQLKT